MSLVYYLIPNFTYLTAQEKGYFIWKQLCPPKYTRNNEISKNLQFFANRKTKKHYIITDWHTIFYTVLKKTASFNSVLTLCYYDQIIWNSHICMYYNLTACSEEGYIQLGLSCDQQYCTLQVYLYSCSDPVINKIQILFPQSCLFIWHHYQLARVQESEFTLLVN